MYWQPNRMWSSLLILKCVIVGYDGARKAVMKLDLAGESSILI
jgi:hypothetical protein